MHVGRPEPVYPFPWALYAWIEGEEVSSASVRDWARYAEDLANIICSLHTIDLMGATRSGDLCRIKVRKIFAGVEMNSSRDG